MSKASNWVKNKEPLIFRNAENFLIANVSNDGDLCLNPVSMDTKTALDLAAWIVEVFGD